MEFRETRLSGVYRLQLDPNVDHRGTFTRTFCRETLENQGLKGHVEQCNVVMNEVRGTLRGIHYHVRPAGEVKMVQCVNGALYEVLVDLRSESETCGEWISMELRGASAEVVYIPKGIGHAYQTLEPNSIVTYFMSEAFRPGTERGIRWNDPHFSIPWPLAEPTLSEKDRSYPDFDLESHRRDDRNADSSGRVT